jgi:squalene-hopene/tetraprenyl-beta-curcumene cyclase
VNHRPDGTYDAHRQTLDRAVDWLLRHQDDAGWWWGHMQTNVTLDAEDLLLRELFGIRTAELTDATARWIRSQQREDGTWATFPGGPGELSTTIEAYVALRLAGDRADDAHMAAAARFVREAGGIERSRMATRTWLALIGQWSWDDLPVLPPEIMLVPNRLPLSVKDFSGWSRLALIPLSIANACRPVHPVPFGVDELRSGVSAPPLDLPAFSVPGLFVRLDGVLHHYAKRPIKPVRRAALRRAENWLVDHQEVDGSWLGVHLLTVFCLLGFYAAGYPVHHPVVRKGLKSLNRFEVRGEAPDGPTRRMECVPGPVWDTSLAVVALTDAGLPGDHPAVRSAGRWLLDEEISARGDWVIRRPDLAAGGWAFSFDNDLFPDCDDTSTVVVALRRMRGGDEAESAALAGACERGEAWLDGMQSADGGWASYDGDNNSSIAAQLPFCDFGEATDPPSADVTAHVVEALAARRPASDPVVRRGVAWLLRAQETNGSWFGRWGVNYVYGTSASIIALVEAGFPPTGSAVGRAVDWLLRHQNADGGWGEDIRSYTDSAWQGRGDSTPTQTAWALMALHAAGRDTGDGPVRDGVDWLVANQGEDGTWTEDVFTGTGFPGDFYMGYPLYRQIFPTMALGRLLSGNPDGSALRDLGDRQVAHVDAQ